MLLDEVIETIEQSNASEIQKIVEVTIRKYHDLYPEWRILFVLVDSNATDERSRELLEFIRSVDQTYSQNQCGNLNEKYLNFLEYSLKICLTKGEKSGIIIERV